MSTHGRESPAERVAAILGDPHEGALLVTGAPGSGKTHLLRVAADSAPIRTVTVVGNPVESDLPLSGLSAVLARVDARAAEFAGRFSLRSTDQLALPAAAADILALLRGLKLPPTAVLVDDVDRMDGQSRGLLAFMAGRLGGSGIRLVATATSVNGHDPLAGFPRARLQPLPPDAALALALEAGAPDLHEGTARILVAHSAGNPATLLARISTLRVAQRAGRTSVPLPLPVRRAGRRIARRTLDKLDGDGMRIVHALAVTPLAHPAALADAGIATRDDLDDLIRAKVVEEAGPYVRIRNPLVRAVAFNTLSAGRRRAQHAELVDAARDHAPALADWHRAGTEPDGRHAEALLRGAVELVDHGFVAAAVEFADAALSRAADTPHPGDALEFTRRLLHHGEGALAERYLILVGERELPHAERATVALARLETELERTGRVPHAAAAGVLERHGPTDPEASVRLAATAALWHTLRGETAPARELLDLAAPLRLPPRSDAARLRAVVAGLASSAAPDDDAFDLGAATPPELVARGRRESLREDYERAAVLYARVADEAGASRAWRDLALVLSADNAVRAGLVEEGIAAVGRLHELQLPAHLVPMRVLLESWSDVATGHLDAAESRLRARLAEPHGTEGLVGAGMHALLGWLVLQRGEPVEAAGELAHAELLAGDADPGIPRLHPLLIDALVAAGRPEAARAALTRFEELAARHPGRWCALAVAGARAVVAEADPAGRLFDSALDAFVPGDPPLERARLLLRKGQRMRARGMPEADAVLLQARAAFEAIGATAWFEDVEPVLESSAVLGRLSEPEAAVARLVRAGLQNKEIAAQLFVSVRTVELRLTHIYRKTGIRSRSQLVAALS